MLLAASQKNTYARVPILASDDNKSSKEVHSSRMCQRRSILLLLASVSIMGLLYLASRTSRQGHISSEIDLKAVVSSIVNKDLMPSRLRHEKGLPFNAISIGNLSKVDLPLSQMILPTDGQDMKGKAFNLGLMRLPSGARWEYIAFTRGPQKYHKGETVKDREASAMVSSILGFGLNMTAEGPLVPVSKATFLHIRTVVSQSCRTSHDNEWSGPEDARPYWSDTNTPMISVGIPSTREYCKGIALIQDVRSVWPELAAVLASPDILVRPYKAGEAIYEMMEITKSGQHNGEKNWMPFFSGSVPDPNAQLPDFLYTAAPQIVLTPPNSSRLENTLFLPLAPYKHQKADKSNAQCLQNAFPHIGKDLHHGATPLYRVTLCKRGNCLPTSNNTYLLSLTHILRGDNNRHHHTYSRYASLRSVEPPHDLLAVGPPLQFSGTNDSDIVYAVSLTFRPSSTKAEVSTSHLGPVHGFLDDEVIIGLGLVDDQLAVINASLKDDLLSSMVLCSTLNKDT